MKKLIALIIIALSSLSMAINAQNDKFDYVYLNNGSVVKGVVETEIPNVEVSIRTPNGNLLNYKAAEVRKIIHGEKPTIPTEKTGKDNYKDYSSYNKGFWFSTNAEVGYSTRLSSGVKNGGYSEVDVVGGYRMNQYLKVGAGFGARWYFQNSNIRLKKEKWAFPLFLNVRGNFIPEEYRTAIPYYSLDIGTTFEDGFMIRPTIGMRFGEPRSAFLLSLSYVGQTLKNEVGQHRMVSFLALNLGYEF